MHVEIIVPDFCEFDHKLYVCALVIAVWENFSKVPDHYNVRFSGIQGALTHMTYPARTLQRSALERRRF